MRQQRRNNARGRVQVPNIRPTPDITWAINQVQSDLLICDVFTDLTRLSITGIPALVCSTAPGAITLPHFAGGSLLMTLPSVPTYPCSFSLASADPAIRDSQGAFLAALNQTLTSQTAQPLPLTMLDWTITSFAGADLTLDVPGLDFRIFVDNLGFFEWLVSGSNAGGMTVSGTVVVVTFPGAVLATGQQVTLHNAGLLTDGNARQGLLPKTVTLP